MANYFALLLATTLFLASLTVGESSDNWIYTRPEGACSGLNDCRDCVASYSVHDAHIVQGGIRTQCTWCPAKNTCVIMNPAQDLCSSGDTYRDTCPIPVDPDEMPRCVYFQYAWFHCASTSLSNEGQCNDVFANLHCEKITENRCVASFVYVYYRCTPLSNHGIAVLRHPVSWKYVIEIPFS